jgi:hypothetical protein
LALSPKRFWRLTLAEFDCLCRGYHRREVAAWQRARQIALEVKNGLRPPGTRGETAYQYLPLPGDEVPASTVPATAEEVNDLWAELDARDAAIL